MRASVLLSGTWALASILLNVFALKDFQTLLQPEEIASECALATEANRDPKAHFARSTLVVELNVTAGRFESTFISFNTRTYNGEIPGKTIKVCMGDKLIVRLWNLLGEGTSISQICMYTVWKSHQRVTVTTYLFQSSQDISEYMSMLSTKAAQDTSTTTLMFITW